MNLAEMSGNWTSESLNGGNMIGKNSSYDKVFDECRMDVSKMMAALTLKYRRHTQVLGAALTDSLAHFISISVTDPASVLLAVGKRIAETDYEDLRSAMNSQIFGHSLGVIDGGLAKPADTDLKCENAQANPGETGGLARPGAVDRDG